MTNFTGAKTKRYSFFHMNVNEHLIEIMAEPKMLQKDVSVHYGYHIDFVLNMNGKDEIVEESNSGESKR